MKTYMIVAGVVALMSATVAVRADDPTGEEGIEAYVTQMLELRARERTIEMRARAKSRQQALARDREKVLAREMRRLIANVPADADHESIDLADAARVGFDLTDGHAAAHDVRNNYKRDHRVGGGDAISLGAFQDELGEIPATSDTMSEAELSKQISNPVGALWLLFFQHDITVRNVEGAGDNQVLHNFKFQPVTPIALTDEWRLISRPVIQINGFDVPQADGTFDTDMGLGDTILLQLFSNSDPSGQWMTGFGPTWIFPTATDPTLGGDEWAIGPAALVVYLGPPGGIIAGAVVQSWFSFAGSGDESVNLMDFQPIFRYRATETLNIGFAPNIQYDLAEEDWSIPVGLGFDITTKIGNLPIRFGMEAYHYVDEFDGFDNQWGIRLFFVPVVPAPTWASTPLFGG